MGGPLGWKDPPEEEIAIQFSIFNSLWLRLERIHLQCRRPGFDPWVGRVPLEKGMVAHSSILAWRIPMDRGAWRARVHVVAKDSDMTLHSTA